MPQRKGTGRARGVPARVAVLDGAGRVSALPRFRTSRASNKSCGPGAWLLQRRGEGVREGYPRAPPCWSTAGRVSARPRLRTSRASNCPVRRYGPSMHFFGQLIYREKNWEGRRALVFRGARCAGTYC